MMRCLRFVSIAAIAIIGGSCGNSYRSLERTSAEAGLWPKPVFKKELFRCKVNGRFLFKRFHLSGLLLVKKLGDTTRAVFQNEMGFPFFDFQWDGNDSFSVISINERLNKPALIKTLQNDLEILMVMKLSQEPPVLFRNELGNETWFRYPRNKGYVYYVSADGQYRRIEYGGKSSVTSITFPAPVAGLPEDVHIVHHKAHFTIDLKEISTGSDE